MELRPVDFQADVVDDLGRDLRRRRRPLHRVQALNHPVEPGGEGLVIQRHGYSGSRTMIPSTVGVPPSTSSSSSLMRSPPAATQLVRLVFRIDGVVPAVPRPCTGERSLMVSEPL